MTKSSREKVNEVTINIVGLSFTLEVYHHTGRSSGFNATYQDKYAYVYYATEQEAINKTIEAITNDINTPVNFWKSLAEFISINLEFDVEILKIGVNRFLQSKGLKPIK